VRGLRAGTDYYFRVIAENETSRSVRRDAIQRDALLARPDVERRSGDRGLRHRAARAPVTDVVSADDRLHGRQPDRAVLLPIPHLRRKRRDLPDRRLSDRFHGRRLTVTVTIGIRPVQSHSLFAYMPAVTFSFRFNNGHLTRLPEHQEHLHLDSVSIQLSVSIYISVNLHAFFIVKQ